MRIAIVGAGVSGLVAAYLLHGGNDVAVFEANDRIGGHVNTVDVSEGERTYGVDTGFIVYNETTYPLFTRLLSRLGVATRESVMSFSVRCERSGLEYNGTSLASLFAQKRNLFRPRFHRMIRDILRFNGEAARRLRDGSLPEDLPLGRLVSGGAYSREFLEHYLVPMGAAVWSMPPARLLEFPAVFFARFFENHGFLSVGKRPVWRVVRGGSRTYVDALVRPFRNRIRLSSPVTRVLRKEDHVTVDGERFDHVVFACHSDEALRALGDPSGAEREILAAIPYQGNEALLHTDASLLPRAKRARAAWNAHVGAFSRTREEEAAAGVTVTYDMNRLQSLDAKETYCVTLNGNGAVAAGRRLRSFAYSHPVATVEGAAARRRRDEVSGRGRTHFCGAYWGYGFHEDGVRSAVDVAGRFGAAL